MMFCQSLYTFTSFHGRSNERICIATQAPLCIPTPMPRNMIVTVFQIFKAVLFLFSAANA